MLFQIILLVIRKNNDSGDVKRELATTESPTVIGWNSYMITGSIDN